MIEGSHALTHSLLPLCPSKWFLENREEMEIIYKWGVQILSGGSGELKGVSICVWQEPVQCSPPFRVMAAVCFADRTQRRSVNTHMHAQTGMNECIHFALNSLFLSFFPFITPPTHSYPLILKLNIREHIIRHWSGFVDCLRCAPETTKDRTMEV